MLLQQTMAVGQLVDKDPCPCLCSLPHLAQLVAVLAVVQVGVLAAAVVLVVVLELAAALHSPMPMDHLTRTVEPAVVVVGAALVLVQGRVALPIQLLMMHLHQSRVCAWPL